MELKQHQKQALKQMKNGCILNGGVGSGKSITAIAYYMKEQGCILDDEAWLEDLDYEFFIQNKKRLYIITTARKRDELEWEGEFTKFHLNAFEDDDIIIDSWNNIQKYKDVIDSFFIFDEQRVVGYGKWSKTFIRIAQRNEWILLTATPGDTWSDYIPVFIANGFYKNKTDFTKQHVIYDRYSRFPKVDRYLNTKRLIRLRDRILVDMDFERKTEHIDVKVLTEYDKVLYKTVRKKRWNVFEDKPIENASEFCYTLRKIVNSHESRGASVLEIMEKHPKAIIFYNFDYELDILKSLAYQEGTIVAEWNGHKHQPVPEGPKWAYLVQYTAGAEAWNCITTDTIIFYSQNYSYKLMKQASGRIDRLNTPYPVLYYYHLQSNSDIDLAINHAIKTKKKFNEGKFYM